MSTAQMELSGVSAALAERARAALKEHQDLQVRVSQQRSEQQWAGREQAIEKAMLTVFKDMPELDQRELRRDLPTGRVYAEAWGLVCWVQERPGYTNERIVLARRLTPTTWYADYLDHEHLTRLNTLARVGHFLEASESAATIMAAGGLAPSQVYAADTVSKLLTVFPARGAR